MPTGDVRAWDLFLTIKEHLSELDKYIDKHKEVIDEKVS